MKNWFQVSEVVVLCVLSCVSVLAAQTADFTAVRAEVDFSKHVREWDGFRVNYVEVAQAIDYTQDPQEYGGFGLLTEEKRQQIVDMVFGDDGLKPGLVKMFLDPHQQREPGGGSDTYEAYRTADEKDRYQPLDLVKLEGDTLPYGAPAQSATTFLAK